MINRLISIGVLSTANIAVRSVIPAILNLSDNFVLAGIASRTKDKLTEVCNTFNTATYVGYDELIEDQSIDVVYIPLPNALHAEWIEKALLNRKHVIVEKSLGCSLQEVTRLTDLARAMNLVLFENFQFRFHPQTSLIQNLLNQKTIGEVRCLRAWFGFPPFSDKNNIRYQADLGGGALLDAGAYTTKVSQLFLGLNLKVKSSTLNAPNNSDVDIWGGAYLQDENTGKFAELAFGFDHFYECGIEVWGSMGKLKTNRLFTAPSDFVPIITVETSEGEQIIKAEPANHFELMLLHFYKLITADRDSEEEHLQNIDQARLIQEIKDIAYVN
jgi:dTDP-3,4-didehydro-2,6-dideoxy-alpha-D-glucose 3-reductase